jgi:phosphoribosylformylglycinamidine (FGAM) synthase PurS component
MDKIAVFHRRLDAVQACLNIINSIRITQIRTDLHQSKIKLMIKIMRIDVADLREESLTKDGFHGYGMNQKVLKMVPDVDLDLMTGMKNGKDLEIREEMVPDMVQEEVPEMKNGKVLDMVHAKVRDMVPGKAQEEVLEMKKEKVLDMVHAKVQDMVHAKAPEEVQEAMTGKVLDLALVKAPEEVQEAITGKVLDLALVKAPEEVQEVMSGEVQDMAQEIVLRMKLLIGNSSTIPLMKPDQNSELYLV